MKLLINGRHYLFQWQYLDSEERTQEFFKEHPDHKLYKPNRYSGVTICRIKLEDDSVGKGNLLQVKEGYSFRRKDEKAFNGLFNRPAGRKLSLAHALKDYFNFIERTVIWTEYNAKWPPVNPADSAWKRKYTAVAMENMRLRQVLSSHATGMAEIINVMDTHNVQKDTE